MNLKSSLRQKNLFDRGFSMDCGAVLWGAQIWSALKTDASSWGHYILLLLLFAACALRWFWKWLHTET